MNARSLAPLVLISDADPYICRVFEAKLIKDNQFRVVCTATGSEAFEAALQHPFDVILWDLRLRDSERLLPGLRALSPQAALLLMTTDDLPHLSAEIARLDVTEILTKPFGLDTLVASIRAGMDRSAVHPSITHMDLGRVGQQIAIYSQEGRCITRVLESGPDTFAIVGAPRVETPPDFAPGQRVLVQVQGHDALYRFHTNLLRATDRPIPGWELRMPHTIHREQRRKHPRLLLKRDIFLAAASDHQDGFAASPKKRGQTENIGMNGCSVLFPTDFPVGATVSLELYSGTELCLQGKARVLRSQRLSSLETGENTQARYRLALQFLALPRQDRQHLRTLLQNRV